MKETTDVIACVVDNGLFVNVARRLASEFKHVYYTPAAWETAFPRIADAVIGDGYPEIEWVESLFEVVDKCDLIVFPDIGFAALQEYLVKQGKPVWGSRHADGLEARRGMFLKTLKTTNLPVPKYQIFKGITNLRLALESKEDVYIKVSTYRGDFETAHFRSMEEDAGLLDGWCIRMGPLSEQFKFFVFEQIDTTIEDGCDTWCIDGQWPKTVIHGMECKNKGFLATFAELSDMPEPVRKVNEEFGPILASYGYRGPFSSEVRITEDGKGYFIDPTCRYGSPPHQIQCEMIGNMGEIVWQGANGICVEPEQLARFGVQAAFEFTRNKWNVFKIPESIAAHVRIASSCMVDGAICVPPDHDEPEGIGWLCATGSTIEYAIHNLNEYAKEMPAGATVEIDALADLLKEAHAAEEEGMKFANNVPEPASVID